MLLRTRAASPLLHRNHDLSLRTGGPLARRRLSRCETILLTKSHSQGMISAFWAKDNSCARRVSESLIAVRSPGEIAVLAARNQRHKAGWRARSCVDTCFPPAESRRAGGQRRPLRIDRKSVV